MAGLASDRLFTHNDSGDVARFFAVGPDGRTAAVYTLQGVQARDWEDIERGPGGTLWLGDIGDNHSSRDRGILVHEVAEPTGPSATLTAVSYRLRYEDGPHNAEALLISPRTGRLVIVTKSLAGADVYEAPSRLAAGEVNLLHRVAHLDIQEVTAGDVSPDGRRLVLRNYTAAYEWDVAGDDLVAAMRAAPAGIVLPAQRQGEGISYSRDGQSLLLSSEGVGQPVYVLRRTTATGSTPAPSSAPAASGAAGPAPAAPARHGSRWSWPVPAAAAALVLALAAAVAARRRRRATRRWPT